MTAFKDKDIKVNINEINRAFDMDSLLEEGFVKMDKQDLPVEQIQEPILNLEKQEETSKFEGKKPKKEKIIINSLKNENFNTTFTDELALIRKIKESNINPNEESRELHVRFPTKYSVLINKLRIEHNIKINNIIIYALEEFFLNNKKLTDYLNK